MSNRALRKLDSTLIIPDVHAPFHDPKAWRCMMRVARRLKPRRVIVLGDFVDCYTISAHDKDPRRYTQLSQECGVGRELLEEVEDLEAETNDFDMGNHEDRLRRLLMRSAPPLLDMVSMDGALELREHGWRVHKYMEHANIGKLFHTHEAGHAGIHAVHHTGHAFNKSVVFGHTHRLGVSYFGNVTGGRHFSASLGWLGDVNAATYMPAAKRAAWQLGFGIVRHEKNGNVHLQPVPIVDYRAVLDGVCL